MFPEVVLYRFEQGVDADPFLLGQVVKRDVVLGPIKEPRIAFRLFAEPN